MARQMALAEFRKDAPCFPVCYPLVETIAYSVPSVQRLGTTNAGQNEAVREG